MNFMREIDELGRDEIELNNVVHDSRGSGRDVRKYTRARTNGRGIISRAMPRIACQTAKLSHL